MKTKLKINTSPGHCANLVLVAVAARGESKHSCTGLGGVSHVRPGHGCDFETLFFHIQFHCQ